MRSVARLFGRRAASGHVPQLGLVVLLLLTCLLCFTFRGIATSVSYHLDRAGLATLYVGSGAARPALPSASLAASLPHSVAHLPVASDSVRGVRSRGGVSLLATSRGKRPAALAKKEVVYRLRGRKQRVVQALDAATLSVRPRRVSAEEAAKIAASREPSLLSSCLSIVERGYRRLTQWFWSPGPLLLMMEAQVKKSVTRQLRQQSMHGK